MTTEASSISIIGCGNVGTHLALAFFSRGVNISHIYCRNREEAEYLALKVNANVPEKIAEIPNNGLVIICVPDDQIQTVADQIPSGCAIAYTSGAIRLEQIQTDSELGVFYPLQTFTKNVDLNIFEVPVLIESESEHFTSVLFDLAWKISRTVEYANSEKRGKIHLAAVWVNNFVNHCIYQSDKYCRENDLDFDLLRPLLKETIRKIENQDPFNAQTGPARRGDMSVIDKQMKMQQGLTRELYNLMTKSIINTYKSDEKL